MEAIFSDIEANPSLGTVITNDYSIRKLRVGSRDMKRGKSGGFRLLYKLFSQDDDLIATLLHVYAKADQPDVPLSFLRLLDGESIEEQ